MKIESIAECSLAAFCNTFDLQWSVFKANFWFFFEWPLKTELTVYAIIGMWTKLLQALWTSSYYKIWFGPQSVKTCLRGFRPKRSQTSLLSYRDMVAYKSLSCMKFSIYTLLHANNKGADQPVLSAGCSAPLLFACSKVRFSGQEVHFDELLCPEAFCQTWNVYDFNVFVTTRADLLSVSTQKLHNATSD